MKCSFVCAAPDGGHVQHPAIVLQAVLVFVLSLGTSFLLMHIPYVRFITLGEPPLRSPGKD